MGPGRQDRGVKTRDNLSHRSQGKQRARNKIASAKNTAAKPTSSCNSSGSHKKESSVGRSFEEMRKNRDGGLPEVRMVEGDQIVGDCRSQYLPLSTGPTHPCFPTPGSDGPPFPSLDDPPSPGSSLDMEHGSFGEPYSADMKRRGRSDPARAWEHISPGNPSNMSRDAARETVFSHVGGLFPSGSGRSEHPQEINPDDLSCNRDTRQTSAHGPWTMDTGL